MLALAGALTMNAQNPFAYGLTGEFTAADNAASLKVNYALNTAADAVTLQVLKDGEVVAEETGLGATKGTHTATIDLTTLLSGAEYYGNYTWQIAVTGGATSGSLSLYKTWLFYHPSGLDVDNSFESPSFGTIFVAEGYNDGKTSNNSGTYESAQANGADGGGLYMFTPELTNITKQDGTKRFFPDFLTFNKKDITDGSSYYGADFSKVAVAEDGRIFVSRFNLQGDYILSAPSVADLVENGDFTSLVAGKTMTDAIYNDANNNFLVGPIQSMDVKGSGENTKIIAVTRADNTMSIGFAKNRVVEYNIGNESELVSAISYNKLDGNSVYAYFRNANVVYDNRGGVWLCQYQSQADNLVYVNASGVMTTIASKTSLYRRGAISVSPDGTMLVVAGPTAKYFTVYNINYNEDGTVSLDDVESISTAANNTYSAAWDCAGNVYIGNATNEWVKGYAVPRADNTFATKAASKYAFVIDAATAIDAIEAENAPVEYYNLQGVKVENPSNGIFIKKQGAKATKVVL